ncbi:hypothetical protein ACEQPO_08050 [Bacillus sp. SL00103]
MVFRSSWLKTQVLRKVFIRGSMGHRVFKQNYGRKHSYLQKGDCIFAQGDNAPNKVAVASFGHEFETGDTENPKQVFSVRNALEEYFDKDFHFVL